MKKAIFIIAVILGGFIFQPVSAQVSFSVNIATQPVWGPVGYDHVEYYYMPDIDAYYYVPNRQYIYMERGRWVVGAYLPSRFHYNVNSGYKVVVNDPYPYRNAQMYRTRYAGYRGNNSQEQIRYSHDSRYYENKGHPQHNQWKNEQKNKGRKNNGHGNGHGNGHNK